MRQILCETGFPHAVVEADLEKQIEGHLSHAQLTPGQRSALKSFRLEFCVNRNQKLATQESYLRYICFLGRHVKKEFADMTKDDIIDYLSSLQGKSESLKDWAKLSIKMFFRWQRTGMTKPVDSAMASPDSSIRATVSLSFMSIVPPPGIVF